MYVLVFQSDDGIQQVWTIEDQPTDQDAIVHADMIIREFITSVDALADVDVDFEAGDGTEKRGLWIGTWAIGSEGEYFELWREATVH